MDKKNKKTIIESVFERMLSEKLSGERGRGGVVDRPGYGEESMRGWGLPGSDNPFLRYAPIPTSMFDLAGFTGKKDRRLFPLPPQAYNLKGGTTSAAPGGMAAIAGAAAGAQQQRKIDDVELFRLSKLYFGNPANLSENVWKTIMRNQSSLSSSSTPEESMNAAQADLKALYETVLSALKSGAPGSFIMILTRSLNMNNSIPSFAALISGIKQAKAEGMSNEKIVNLMYGAFLNSNIKSQLESGRRYYIKSNSEIANEYDKYWSNFAANLRPY